MAAETEVGKAAKGYMDEGKLVPDEVIIGVVSQTVSFSFVGYLRLCIFVSVRKED